MAMWTTIVVGRDGQMFDLGNKEFPPNTFKDSKKAYFVLFGQACSQQYADHLKTMTKTELLKYLK